MRDLVVFLLRMKKDHSKPYRSLPKFNSKFSMNRYNIIVVSNQRYGLKRYSGMLGSISDFNIVVLQSYLWVKYCSFARHNTNLKIPHTNKFCIVTPNVSSKYRYL